MLHKIVCVQVIDLSYIHKSHHKSSAHNYTQKVHFIDRSNNIPVEALLRLGAETSCPLGNERHLVVIIIPSHMCYETSIDKY